jgi:hypothetical protein
VHVDSYFIASLQFELRLMMSGPAPLSCQGHDLDFISISPFDDWMCFDQNFAFSAAVSVGFAVGD